MALVQYLFDGGTEGAALSNVNSGSSATSIGAGSSTVFAASMAAHGPFGARFINGAGANSYRRYPLGAANTVAQFSGVFTLPATYPASTVNVGAFVNAAGATRLAVQLRADGSIMLADAAGGTYKLANAGELTVQSKYRITIQAVGGSTTAGQINAKIYSGSSSWVTPIGLTVATSTANLNTDSFIGFDTGMLSSPAASYTIGWDDLQLNDGAGAEIADIQTSLASPVLTISNVTDPSTVGGSNGSVTISWPAVANAHHYEATIVVGTVSTGFTATDTNATSPKTFSGLSAGPYTVAVRAKASA